MRRGWILGAALALLGGCAHQRVLTVCADPNNMPFSNARGEGFENRIAEIIAGDLKAKLRYVWWAQRRGFVRNTIGQARCDAWMGVPSTFDPLLTTRPYYRSTYVFVTRAGDRLNGLTLDDPRLKHLRLGIQLAGDDGNNPPPETALARRGLIPQTRGFMLYGDARQPDPAADIVKAVTDKDIDVALVWGPLAGWHAAASPVPLRVEPVTPWLDQGRWPMVFEISVGVSKRDPALKREIEAALARNQNGINKVLTQYKVPLAAGG